jgi:hypothetical protein
VCACVRVYCDPGLVCIQVGSAATASQSEGSTIAMMDVDSMTSQVGGGRGLSMGGFKGRMDGCV